MHDYTPGFDKRQLRINGRWGRGPGANAVNFNTISYINPQAFQCPDSSPTNPTYSCGNGGNNGTPNKTFKIGNIARTAPLRPARTRLVGYPTGPSPHLQRS